MCLSTLYMTLSTAPHSLVANPESRGRQACMRPSDSHAHSTLLFLLVLQLATRLPVT